MIHDQLGRCALAIGCRPRRASEAATCRKRPPGSRRPAAEPPFAGRRRLRPARPRSRAPERDYVIGPGDVLAIVFWREPDMSAEVIVRPDGRISIPLLNDIDVSRSDT